MLAALEPAWALGAFVAYGSFASVVAAAVVGTAPSSVCPVESRLVDSCVACLVDCCQDCWYLDAFDAADVVPFGDLSDVAACPWNGLPSCHPWSPCCCSCCLPLGCSCFHPFGCSCSLPWCCSCYQSLGCSWHRSCLHSCFHPLDYSFGFSS